MMIYMFYIAVVMALMTVTIYYSEKYWWTPFNIAVLVVQSIFLLVFIYEIRRLYKHEGIDDMTMLLGLIRIMKYIDELPLDNIHVEES